VWFYAEPCRVEKHAQEEKEYRRRTELNGGRRGGIYSLTRETPLSRPYSAEPSDSTRNFLTIQAFFQIKDPPRMVRMWW